MPKQALENLTESMFYLLMALTRGDACGADITAFAAQISGGRQGLCGGRRAAAPRHSVHPAGPF